MVPLAAAVAVGSSPRMWGTGHPAGSRFAADRFIPTHVGNGCAPCCPPSNRSVHPHACGERRAVVRFADIDGGSSPRMWGTAVTAGPCALCQRFIPTHVGNGSSLDGTTSSSLVHPHACGERTVLSAVTATNDGSSPRMWGTGTGSA